MQEMRVFPLNERFSGPEWNETNLRRYKQLQYQLQIINGVLVRNYKIEPFSETRTVLIYPDTMKIGVLCQVHDEAGHQGIEKTLSRLKLVAFWVNMASDVVNYVTSLAVVPNLGCMNPLGVHGTRLGGAPDKERVNIEHLKFNYFHTANVF